jgi:hypothetical protein
VRFFGGWDYTSADLNSKNWIKRSYSRGVPMGGDLPPRAQGKSPTFVAWAVKDPTSGNLDRIQIVKGWSKNGQSFEKIYDVVWCDDRPRDPVTGKVPPIRSTVDVAKGTYSNTIGSVELKTTWTDPDFDPSLHAFYYARVLEIPTPRWTTIQAHQLGIAPPDVVPPTVQERAWSSPIWYTPSAEARKNAPQAMTVADLKQNGATALNDAQLKALLVGKAVWMRNTVTGEQFKVSYIANGQNNVWHLGTNATVPSDVGNLAQNGYQGVTVPYTVEGGKVVTTVSQEPYAVAVYNLRDKYYGSRSNEFGYANYEMLPKPPSFLHPLSKGETAEEEKPVPRGPVGEKGGSGSSSEHKH